MATQTRPSPLQPLWHVQWWVPRAPGTHSACESHGRDPGLQGGGRREGEPPLPPGQDFRKGPLRLTFSEQPPRSGLEQGLLGVQEKPSPSKPSRQTHLQQQNGGPPVSLWKRPAAEQTDTHGQEQGREEKGHSPGDAPLADAAGMLVAVLGLLRGPTASLRLITEAAAEAWSTCALLTPPPAARTVVAEPVDTAAVCREDMGMGMGKVRQGQGRRGARVRQGGGWERGRRPPAQKTSGSPNQGPPLTRWAGRGNARGQQPFLAISHPILAALPRTPPSMVLTVHLT